MKQQSSNYNILIKKIDEFTRKFYVNKLIKGSLYFVGLMLLLFLLFSFLEYKFFFPGAVRKGLLLSFIGVLALSLVYWIGMPVLNYLKLGKVISHEQAATIIGNHFSDVKDRLLNILQLKQQSTASGDSALISASIDQKIESLKPVPFKRAVDFNTNKKYLKFALIPVLSLVVLLFAAPNIITDGSERIIKNNIETVKPVPFYFELLNDNLEVLEYEPLEIKIEVKGEFLPNEVYLQQDEYTLKMTKNENNIFVYKFDKVTNNINFYVNAQGIQSEEFSVTVLPKPAILGFTVELDYPSYIKRKSETLKNLGDLNVPKGTKAYWKFNAKNTDEVKMLFADTALSSERLGENLFSYKKSLYSSTPYQLLIANNTVGASDSIAYNISVISDQHPTIKVENKKDSTVPNLTFFTGEIADDYGFSQLHFKYTIEGETSSKPQQSKPIAFNPLSNFEKFSYYVDVNEFALQPGDKITYYFEVWDNDAVSGVKSARTNPLSFKKPSIKELEQSSEADKTEFKENLKEAIEESKALKEDIKDLKEKLLEKKNMEWNDKKAIENMINKQQELKNQIEELQKQFENNQNKEEEFKEFSESIEKKREQLQEIMDELLNDEMKEMLEKFEEMMDDLKKDDALEELEEMDLTDEELEKELERMLELFKQMEAEQEMTEAIEKLEELAEKQEELAEENKEGEKSKEELVKEQEKIQEEFKDIQEKLEKLEEKAEELEDFETPNTEEEQKEAEQNMEQGKEEMKKGQKNKSSKSQEQAAEKMKEMAKKMQESMNAQMEQNAEEDMKSLRQILENLVDVSFDQERIKDEIAATNKNNPNYKKLVQEQHKLKDDMRVIEDSLTALSKRVFEISSFVNRELSEIKRNLADGIKKLEDRKVPQASVNQQFVMTSLNNLALMLDETMQQMQSEMSSQMQGNQMCNNPKGSGKGMPKMSGKQGGLKKQMEQMMKQMAGESGQGGKGKDGKREMSKQLAEMAKQQSAIRDAIQKHMNESGNGEGSPDGDQSKELKKAIEQMEKVEKDIVNKNLTHETLKRQKDIMTRLLKAEEAERQREMDNKRESQTAQDKTREIPPSMAEYLKKREAEIDLYKEVPPALKPYYKTLVQDYFKSISY